MTQDWDAWDDVAGAELLRKWFGAIPTFHDAGIEELTLTAGQGASIKIRAFRMTDQVDERGYFVLDKHAYVTFKLSGVGAVELEDFDQNSVISQLLILRAGDNFELVFVSHIGVSGRLLAERISLEVDPVLVEAQIA